MTKLISVKELAEQIKFSPITIYRWVKARKIPHVKMPGNDIRFDKEIIENWIQLRTIKSKNLGQ